MEPKAHFSIEEISWIAGGCIEIIK